MNFWVGQRNNLVGLEMDVGLKVSGTELAVWAICTLPIFTFRYLTPLTPLIHRYSTRERFNSPGSH